jgi:hypothetical protein
LVISNERLLIIEVIDKETELVAKRYSPKGGTHMRTLARTAVALGFVGAMAIGTIGPVTAQGIYFNAPGVHIGVGHPYHRHYYDYYGGGGAWNTYNGCRPGFTIQGGACRPYRYGPWDYSYR